MKEEKTKKSFAHKKSLGQNFLNNSHVPKAMCDAGDVTTGETVLEIGPGTGALTKELLARGAKVIALEADERAVAVLKETFEAELAAGQFRLHHLDARNYDPASLGLSNHSFKIVANIPYYLSGFLFRTILEHDIQPNTLVFLIQKEVALRLTEPVRTGKHSLLSLGVTAYGDVQLVKKVGKGNFTPPPKVDSAIVAVRNIDKHNFQVVDEAFFFDVLHLAFGQKRKTVANNLSPLLAKSITEQILTDHSLSKSTRAEDVTLSKWLSLCTAFRTAMHN